MKWTQCCQEARRQLAFDQFVPIGGDTENGKKLLALIRKLHADTAKTNRIVIPRKKPTAKCPWRPPRPRDNLIDVRHYVDYGKGNVPVSEVQRTVFLFSHGKCRFCTPSVVLGLGELKVRDSI